VVESWIEANREVAHEKLEHGQDKRDREFDQVLGHEVGQHVVHLVGVLTQEQRAVHLEHDHNGSVVCDQRGEKHEVDSTS